MSALFIVFMKIGLVSFGGGYSVIALMEREAISRSWLAEGQFQELVSVAGTAPGPIATNAATLIGYDAAGIGGAIAATAGIVLPSLLIMILLASVCLRLFDKKLVKSSLYGLRAVVTGIIAYSALHFGFLSHRTSFFTWQTIATLMICAGALIGIVRFKLHPVMIVLASGLAGIVLF
ncbi:chromate transporter [Paenibacillus sacheonensis]|uniref:Chromate transporter n=1 Tax=Paenibacillus sacheonensis TaxID=742054 RepID=A0A7X4YSP1_9BACL|nr:chromate transporter [Paenibacillus sacheonensis]NBC71842.1 chromate transporter [Paenibacillus sacheonensis]